MAGQDEEDIVVAIEPDLFEGKDEAAGKTEQKRDDASGQFVKTKPDDPAEVLAQQYKDLQADNDRQREATANAERVAREAREDAERARKAETEARTEAVDSQIDTVTSGLAAAQAEAASAEQEYTAAFEKGDAAAMAKANRKMANAEARAGRLEEAKADLEVRKVAKPAEDETRRAEPKRDAAPDPVDAYINSRTAPTQKWLREHKDWVSDPKKNAKLTAAHYDAVAQDIAVDTPEYFEHVETYTGIKTANGKTNGAAKPPARKQSVPVAPVHQSGGGGTNGGAREVRLSQGEARAAQDGTHIWNYDDPSPQKRFKKGDPIGIQEMARRKLELTKQGAYDRTYTES